MNDEEGVQNVNCVGDMNGFMKRIETYFERVSALYDLILVLRVRFKKCIIAFV
jgi:hypothetical protein